MDYNPSREKQFGKPHIPHTALATILCDEIFVLRNNWR